MPELHVLKVFVGDGGAGGNPLGVFLRGRDVPEPDRQRVAAELGFSETIFVDEPERGEVRIFTPGTELPFAGHPLVGAAWLLAREGYEVNELRPPAGDVPVRVEGELTFISGRPEWAPPFEHVRLDSVSGYSRRESISRRTRRRAHTPSGCRICWDGNLRSTRARTL